MIRIMPARLMITTAAVMIRELMETIIQLLGKIGMSEVEPVTRIGLVNLE
jgi:hypothetical protein